ncbi:MAG: hypothetical protein HZA78_09515 [Candidatus Schekmanbacteria bacterium]|nr:hypothetical protein [Candidatus Schekmanbacteria bacterium]
MLPDQSAKITIENIRNKIASLGIKEEDIEDAIRWARKTIKVSYGEINESALSA